MGEYSFIDYKICLIVKIVKNVIWTVQVQITKAPCERLEIAAERLSWLGDSVFETGSKPNQENDSAERSTGGMANKFFEKWTFDGKRVWS